MPFLFAIFIPVVTYFLYKSYKDTNDIGHAAKFLWGLIFTVQILFVFYNEIFQRDILTGDSKDLLLWITLVMIIVNYGCFLMLAKNYAKNLFKNVNNLDISMSKMEYLTQSTFTVIILIPILMSFLAILSSLMDYSHFSTEILTSLYVSIVGLITTIYFGISAFLKRSYTLSKKKD